MIATKVDLDFIWLLIVDILTLVFLTTHSSLWQAGN